MAQMGVNPQRFFDNHALLAQGGGRTFAHIAIANDQRLLTRHQVIDTTLDGIVEAVTAAILVIVFRFGNGVVNVNGRYLSGYLRHTSLSGDGPRWWFLSVTPWI